ncbi:hypothetical protein V7O62_05005 [Methanolobus sp. ZRKC2]|uniref:hypothetical protein n=1 Tax=Methanolobus sp. ZRKC2 TaxID=3125783 RepID=UPI0032539D33
MIYIDPIAIPFRELLSEFSEEEIGLMIKSFTCSREPFIEDFVQNKCIHAEKMGDTKSYFILDNDSQDLEVLGYYALTLKVICLKEVSKKKAKLLHLSDTVNQYIPTYYIAILAKNDQYKDNIEGSKILHSALEMIQNASDFVGGRVVWVEAKKQHPGVTKFYEENGFKEFQEEEQEDGLYSHLLKVIKKSD